MTAERPGRLTLRGIEVFVAAIEEGSLAGAAKRLGASLSAVSEQVSNLEAALGAPLIDRSARPIAPTRAGYVFQRRALRILDEIAGARADLVELDLVAMPELRLAVIDDFDPQVTAPLIARLSELQPGTRFAVRQGLSQENVSALQGRRVDMVVATEFDAAPDWVESHPLLSEPYILVAAAGLLEGADNPVSALMTAPMVRYSHDQVMGRRIEAHLRRLRISPPQRFEFAATPSMAAMVERCRGWMITTPFSVGPAWERPGLTLAPLPFRGFTRTLSLHARRGALASAPARTADAIRDILDGLVETRYRPALPWLGERMAVLRGEGEAPAPDV